MHAGAESVSARRCRLCKPTQVGFVCSERLHPPQITALRSESRHYAKITKNCPILWRTPLDASRYTNRGDDMSRRRIGFWLGILLAFAGCARFPEAPTERGVRRLIIEMQVAGRIRPEYHYFVVFNLSNDPTGSAGPLPVVSPPWGSGFASGAFTHYVRYAPFLPQGGYALYRVEQGTESQPPPHVYLGVPIRVEPVDANSNRLRFEIDIIQLIPNKRDARQMRFIQLNFITTDIIPTDPNAPVRKNGDSLGDSRIGEFRYLNLRIDQDRLVRNSDLALESADDVADPDLDIVDWRVEVRTP